MKPYSRQTGQHHVALRQQQQEARLREAVLADLETHPEAVDTACLMGWTPAALVDALVDQRRGTASP